MVLNMKIFMIGGKMVLNNVYVNIQELDKLINTLGQDNEEIFEIIHDINKNILDIDNTKWQSPERKKIDDEFIPYILSKEKNIKIHLNDCKRGLITARNNYLTLQK